MWKSITKEQIREVKVGDFIKVNGIITELESQYEGNDYGFDVVTPIPVFNPDCPVVYFIDTFGDSSWDFENDVSVWVDDPR